MNIIFIALGGACGAVLRYFSFEVILKIMRNSNLAHFPFATLFVNVIGSIVIGVFYYFLMKNFDNFDAGLKNFLMVGLLGSFTTFSTFSLDFFRLFNAGQYLVALTYVFVSMVLCILAVFFGFYLMKIFA